jgi:hypothetical protein
MHGGRGPPVNYRGMLWDASDRHVPWLIADLANDRLSKLDIRMQEVEESGETSSPIIVGVLISCGYRHALSALGLDVAPMFS